MSARDGVLRAIEAAHAAIDDDREWLTNVVRELNTARYGTWVAYILEGKRSDRFVGSFPFDTALIADCMKPLPAEVVRAGHAPAPPVATSIARWKKVCAAFGMTYAELERDLGYSIPPMTGMLATDARGNGPMFFNLNTSLPPATRPALAACAAHIAAAYRLRTRLRTPDAWFAGDGRMLDGQESAAKLREPIALAVRAMDRARGRLRRLDPDEAVRAWSAMVDGTWSLVDRVERDGKRLVLVHRNPPRRSIAALTGMEAKVATFAALAHSDKYIAYELGVARSTVSTHLRSALRKLRLRDRSALVALYGPLARGPR